MSFIDNMKETFKSTFIAFIIMAIYIGGIFLGIFIAENYGLGYAVTYFGFYAFLCVWMLLSALNDGGIM